MGAIFVRIRCKPTMAARFEALAAEMIDNTRATEPFCRRYEYWRASESYTYYVMELFDDVNGFYAHEAGGKHVSLGPHFLKCFEDAQIEWIDPLGSAHGRFPATRDAPLPRDSDGAIGKEKEKFPPPDIAWWTQMRARQTIG